LAGFFFSQAEFSALNTPVPSVEIHRLFIDLIGAVEASAVFLVRRPSLLS